MRERRREDRDEDAGRAGHCGVRLASGHPRLLVPATKPRDCLPIHHRYLERQCSFILGLYAVTIWITIRSCSVLI